MIYATQKKVIFWTITICLGLALPFIQAQSALLSVSSYSPTINDSLENLILHSVDGPYLFRDQSGAKVVKVVQSATQYHILEESVDLSKPTTLTETSSPSFTTSPTFSTLLVASSEI